VRILQRIYHRRLSEVVSGVGNANHLSITGDDALQGCQDVVSAVVVGDHQTKPKLLVRFALNFLCQALLSQAVAAMEFLEIKATGTGERDAAKEMAADLAGAHQKTIGSAVFGLHVIAYNLISLGNLLLTQPSPQE